MTVHIGVFTIGALAGATGCNSPTIRYYEEIGLLPKANRRPGGQRIYDQDDFRRLTFIRRCRDFGFPIEQVRELVELTDNAERDCVAARDLAQARLNDVRTRLSDLRALERSLATFVETCTSACAGRPGTPCAVLEDMASPRSKGCCSKA